MDFYKKNLECLRQCKKHIAEKINDANGIFPNIEIEGVKSVPAKDGSKVLVLTKESKEYRLNSLYKPEAEARKWCEQFGGSSAYNIFTMFGLGNGVFVKEFVKKMDATDYLLIYEPSVKVFLHVMENYDLTELFMNSKISITIKAVNDTDFHFMLKHLVTRSRIKNLSKLIHPLYDELFTKECIEYFKEIKDSYHHTIINMNTEAAFAEKFIDNIFSNIKFLTNSSVLLEVKRVLPENAVAVIVAAGPSVEENVEQLRRLKGKALIVAVDRVIDFLLDSGIQPDLLVTLDPNKRLEDYSKRQDLEIPLICFMESNTAILHRHKGKKIIANSSPLLDKLYESKQMVPPQMISSPSVATMAFTACVSMGIKKIILVGQDLAYKNNKSHIDSDEEEFNADKDVMLEGVEGKEVRSRYDWKEFVIWFQDAISLSPNLEVVDAKLKGAKIKGTINMTLKEAANKYCTSAFTYEKSIGCLRTLFDQDDAIIILECLRENMEKLDEMNKNADKAIKICKNLILDVKRDCWGGGNCQKRHDELKEINEFLEKQEMYNIMEAYVSVNASQALLDIYQFTDDKRNDSISTYEKAIAVYQATKKGIKYVKSKMQVLVENGL